jgi:tetratricopeptide (TPR) repeat protein
MRTMLRAISALAFGILALATSLEAGTQGRVSGKVTDSEGNPIEGATVTITTPAIKNFKLTVKTNKSGQYGLIVNDSTIHYQMKFEKEGFAPAGIEKKFSSVEVTVVDQKLSKSSEGAVKPASAPAAPPPPSTNDQAAVAYNAGVDLLNSGDKAGAETKFQEAVAKNPDLPQGWYALASLSYQKGDWAKTLEYGKKATELDPTNTNLYSMLADAAQKSGDKKTAADWRKKYEEANPDSPEIFYNRGIDAYNQRKMKEAEELLTKAVQAKPDFALAHFWLGMASFNLNKKAQSREHLQKYLELDPNGGEAATAKEILPLVK